MKPRGKNRFERIIEKRQATKDTQGLQELVSVLSIIYQVHSLQAYYLYELEESLKQNNLVMDKVPKLLKNIDKSLDDLFEYMGSVLTNEANLVKDFEFLVGMVENWRHEDDNNNNSNNNNNKTDNMNTKTDITILDERGKALPQKQIEYILRAREIIKEYPALNLTTSQIAEIYSSRYPEGSKRYQYTTLSRLSKYF